MFLPRRWTDSNTRPFRRAEKSRGDWRSTSGCRTRRRSIVLPGRSGRSPRTMVSTSGSSGMGRALARLSLGPGELLLGPGESIGGAIGTAIVREGYRGIRNKADFERVQATDEPVLLSLGRKRTLVELLKG